MTSEAYIQAFTHLKANLVDNLAIYHERMTLLVQLTVFDIQATRDRFQAKIIKPLHRQQADIHHLYWRRLLEKEVIKFGCSYQMGSGASVPLLRGYKVGRPYCPFTLWLDPALARFVYQNSDEVTKQIPLLLLADADWTHLQRDSKN